MASDDGWIEVRGARTHNLRGVDVRLPRGKLIVFCGVSGSGKTSLAFDTIFAEGRRRYLECVAPFARRFLDQLPTPEVESIVGLPPTLSVEQHVGARRSPRSTVGTLTEIADFLRVLYARCGSAFCPQCGRPILVQTLDEMLDAVLALPEGEKIHILAPLVRGKKGSHREELLRIKREGFVRGRLDGVLILVDGSMQLDPERPHDLEMVVDRQVVRPGLRDRLGESLQAALKHGEGTVIVATLNDEMNWVDRLFSTRFACPACDIAFPELEPRTFNFNSPYGACPTCQGLGRALELSFEKLAPDFSLSIADGALAPFRKEKGGLPTPLRRELESWVGDEAWLTTPVEKLPSEVRDEVMLRVAGYLQNLEAKQSEEEDDDPFAEYRDEIVCPECCGQRLGLAGRSVRIADRTIAEFSSLTIDEAMAYSAGWEFSPEKTVIAEPVVREIRARLEFLARVGVGYIELNRPVATLSGGEAQRIRLAGCVGAGLRGVCYVLDEPSIGLHPRDGGRLITVLEELRDRGNTLVVVEHDEAVIRRADWLLDLGPGAGSAGGTVVNQGDLQQFLGGAGLTADYLAGRRKINEPPSEVRTAKTGGWLTLTGATHRNLKSVSLRAPLGRLIAITGVSGSGKSSLVMEVLVPALRRALDAGGPAPGPFQSLDGFETITRVVMVDQHPIGRTPRSIPATFTGVLDAMRSVYAQTREAKARGYASTRFTFNHKTGQCPECKGLGAKKLDLSFLPDQYVPCPVCRGRRYNASTLEIRFRGRTIAEALAMTIAEAAEFFASHPRIFKPASMLAEIGLGYLTLDQWATTISGGEAQRLKLGAELARGSEGAILFVLDEPTTGLHFHDVAQLLGVFRRLVAQGHTVLAIEHHLDLIRAADWVIDLGPEGGSAGGEVIVQGTPEDVERVDRSATGRALRKHG